MINFLKFIDEDIEMKTTLISTMPTNTKRDIKKYNEKVDSITEKYVDYKAAVKKYIDTKSKSFNVKDSDKSLEKLNKNVAELEHVRFILNPTNTFNEKIGFDNLLYEMSNYYNFNFDSLNEVISQFLTKFESADIKLKSDDFDYTCYVHEYMTCFLEEKSSKEGNCDKLSEVFERIYWVNPEIIQHIELNFRKLINKYEKKFVDYINKLQKKVMIENSVTSYQDCLDKLKIAYNQLNEVDSESIADIIKLAKSGAIDMNNYFEDSKTRIGAYNSLMINSSNITDKVFMNKFYDILRKLKNNVEEYNNYIKFTPLIENFRKEYEKQISKVEVAPSKGNTDKNNPNKTLKDTQTKISLKESQLEKMNKKIFGGEPILFDFTKGGAVKKLKIDSIKIAKELYDLYKIHEQEYFKEKVMEVLNDSLTVSDLLHLYYSFDYFKKMAIQKAFNTTVHEEIVKYSEEFDLFAMNPTNIIVNGVAIFEETNISRIIMNKYRLDNINLNEDNLNPDELETLLNKILFLLRVNEIEKSSTTVEKIWFMAQVEKINVNEKKKEQETS